MIQLVGSLQIVNWFPVGYIDISGIEQNSISKAPALKDVLEKRSQRYDPYLIYVACYGVVSTQKHLMHIQLQNCSADFKLLFILGHFLT